MSGACRVTVQANGDDRACAVDLTLPTQTALGLLIPPTVDLINAENNVTWPAQTVCDWRLSRPGGPALADDTTLAANNICDGELLMLSAIDMPASRPAVHDPYHAVADAATAPDRHATR